MKICLINPPLKTEQGVGKVPTFQPLGLAYVAAMIEKEHDVCIIDANVEGCNRDGTSGAILTTGLDSEELKDRIRDFEPDLVGITVPFSVNAASSLETASLVKAVRREIVTVFGGPHPTIRPVETLSHPDVDIVVIGEGEHTISELVEAIETRALDRLHDVKGICFSDGSRPVVTEPRPMITDLDSLPFPARHLLPMKKYFEAYEEGESARSLYTFHSRWASMITSRGCPFKCNFCSIYLSMGNSFRERSPENVLLEIDQLVNRFGVRHINFEDDNLTFDRKRVYDICSDMVKRDYNLTWSTPNGIRADIIDAELVQMMARSGCKRVFVAPESGDQRVLTEIIGKSMDLAKVEEAVRLFTQYGITVDGSFVIGSIGETKKEIWKTIRYALKLKRLGLATAGFHIATPLYGTRLYEEAKTKGFLTEDFSDKTLTSGRPLIETPEWTGAELRRLQGIANWLVNYGIAKKILSLLRRWGRLRGYLREVITEFMPSRRRRCE